MNTIDESTISDAFTSLIPSPLEFPSPEPDVQGNLAGRDAPEMVSPRLDFSGLKPFQEEKPVGDIVLPSKAEHQEPVAIPLPDPQEAQPEENAPVSQPEVSGENLEKEQYWDRLLTGNLDTIPTEVKQTLGVESTLGLEAQQQISGNIMRSWAVDHMNLSPEEVQANWNTHRNQLAATYQTGDDDYELFLAISEDNKVKKQGKQQIHELYQQGFEAALRGEKEEGDKVKKLKSNVSKIPDALQPIVDEVLAQAFESGAKERQRLAHDVDTLWKGMQFFLAGDTPPEQYKEGTDPNAAEYKTEYTSRLRAFAPHMNKAVARLQEMSEEDKAKVYFILQEKKRKQDDLSWTMLRSVGRSVNNLWMNAAQFGGNMASYMMDELGQRSDEMFGESDTMVKRGSKQLDAYLKAAEELRRMAQEELASVELKSDASWVDKMLADSASTIPLAGLAFSGPIGLVMLGTTETGRQVANARQLAPEGDLESQLGAAMAAGTVNTALNLYLGKLGQKILTQSLKHFSKARLSLPQLPSTLDKAKLYGGATGRSAAYAAGDFAQMHATNKAMELVEMGAQEAAGALTDKASCIDWDAWMEHNKLAENQLREGLAMLPFVLIGAGKVSLRHFRHAKSMLGTGGYLRMFGIDPKLIERIVSIKDLDEQNILLRRALQESPVWGGGDFMARATEVLQWLADSEGKPIIGHPDDVKAFLELGPLSTKPIPDGSYPGNPARSADGQNLFQRYKSLYWKMVGLESISHQMGEWWQTLGYPDVSFIRGKAKTLRKIEQMDQKIEERNILEIDDESSIGMPEFLVPGRNITAKTNELNRIFVKKRFDDVHKRVAQFMFMRHDLNSIFAEGTRAHVLPKIYAAVDKELKVVTFESAMRLARGESWKEVKADMGVWILDKMIDRTNYRADMMFRPFPQAAAWFAKFKRGFLYGKSELMPPREAYVVFDNLRKLSPSVRMDLPDYVKSFTRFMWGVQADARMLYEAIISGPDFKAVRAQGMTPKKALASMLMKDMGLTRKDIIQHAMYPLPKSELPQKKMYPRKISPLVDRSLERLELIVSDVLESRVDEQGRSCYRAKLPNGSYTFWHHSMDEVKREYQVHLEEIFSPVERLRRTFYPDYPEVQVPSEYNLNDVTRKISTGVEEGAVFDELTQRTTLDLLRYYLQTTGVKAPGEQTILYTKPKQLSQENYPQIARRFSSPDKPFYELLSSTSIVSVDNGRLVSRMIMDVQNLPLVVISTRAEAIWSRLFTQNSKEFLHAVEALKSLGRLPRDFEPSKGVYDPQVLQKLGELSRDYVIANFESPLLPQNFTMWVRYGLIHPMYTQDIAQKYRQETLRQKRKMKVLKEGEELDLTEWSRLLAVEQLQILQESYQRAQRLMQEIEALPQKAQFLDYVSESVGMNPLLIAERIWNTHYMSIDGASKPLHLIKEYDGLSKRENYAERNTYLERIYHAMHHGNVMDVLAPEQRVYFAQRLMKYRTNAVKIESPLIPGRSIYDSAVDRLENLKMILRKYPEMHFWGGSKEYRMPADYNNFKQISRRDPLSGTKDVVPPSLTLKELSSLKSLGRDFKIMERENLPEDWQKDPLAVTAMRTLNHIRMHLAHKPVISVNGISQEGVLYTVDSGNRPMGLDESWQASHTLSQLFDRSKSWDESVLLPVTLPKLDTSMTAAKRFPYSVEYRREGELDTVVRLVPGFIGSDVLETAGPYCKTFYKGTYLKGRKGGRHWITGTVAYVPLDVYAFREADYQHSLQRPFPAYKMVIKIATGLSELSTETAEWFPAMSRMNFYEAAVSLYDYMNMEQVIQEKELSQMDIPELLTLKFVMQLINDPDILSPRSLTRDRDREQIVRAAKRFLRHYKKKTSC